VNTWRLNHHGAPRTPEKRPELRRGPHHKFDRLVHERLRGNPQRAHVNESLTFIELKKLLDTPTGI